MENKKNKKQKILLIVIMLVILIVYACFVVIKNKNIQKNKSSQNDKYEILTSFYPMYIATLNIADGIDGVTVENLTQPTTGCLHDYQLSPNEMIRIEKADVFVINGAGMENFIDKAMSSYPNLKVVDSSENIQLIKDEDGEVNPHLWVSISEYIKQVQNIADGLSQNDLKNSDKYQANAKIYISKLEAEKQKMHDGLKNITQKNIVTFHEAFPYFAQEFGLNIVATVQREPGTEPSPDEIVDTINLVKQSNTKALFAEPQYSKDAAETIAKETGAKVYMLDPIVTGDYDKDAYLKTMDKNLAVLEEALK